MATLALGGLLVLLRAGLFRLLPGLLVGACWRRRPAEGHELVPSA